VDASIHRVDVLETETCDLAPPEASNAAEVGDDPKLVAKRIS